MNAAALQTEDGAERNRGPLRVLHPAVGAFVVATGLFCVCFAWEKGGGEMANEMRERTQVPEAIWSMPREIKVRCIS